MAISPASPHRSPQASGVPAVEQTLAQVGEFALIDRITADLPMPAAVQVGPGDDAAVFLVNGSLVCSTDMLIEGVHFRRDWSPAGAVGRKAVAVNVSDLEAMGAVPLTMVVALGAPTDCPTGWLDELSAGLREEAERAGIALVGGDLTRAAQVTICVTAMGQTEGLAPVLRSGARPGDLVALRGRLGWAAAGLAALARGFRSPRAAVDAHRVPEPPYGAGRQALAAGATAMIDVSDGLLADLGHIARASEVAIDLDLAAFVIPDPVRAVAAATGTDAFDLVLTGGEDHALAATFPPGRVPADWLPIGRVGEPGEQGPRVTVDGRHHEVASEGWTHF